MGTAHTKHFIPSKSEVLHCDSHIKFNHESTERSLSTSNLASLGCSSKSNLHSTHLNSRQKSISVVTNPYPDFIIKLGQVLEEKSSLEEKCKGIGKTTFQKCISKASKTLGIRLFEFFLREEGFLPGSPQEFENQTLTVAAFVHQANIHLSCISDTQQLDYYIKVFSHGEEDMTYNSFSELVSTAYEIACFAHHDENLSSDNLLSAICKAAMHGKDKTSLKYIFNWICQHIPRLVMWMHRYVNHTLTVGYSTIPNDVPTKEEDNVTPILEKANESSCANMHPALIWMLSCSLPSSYISNCCPIATANHTMTDVKDPHTYIKKLIMVSKPSHWIPLFNSDEHGHSINRFMHHAFDYHGPTLLFITVDDESMFCLASDEEWRDSKHFYGGIDSMFLQLYPEYRIIERGSKMLYFNVTSRGFPTGVQVGCDSANRTLLIDLNLEFVHYKKIPFKLKSLEVWGCGTVRTRENQIAYKNQVRKDVESRRKVNVNVDWKDNPDRYLLEMAGNRPNYVRFEKETQSHDSSQ